MALGEAIIRLNHGNVWPAVHHGAADDFFMVKPGMSAVRGS